MVSFASKTTTQFYRYVTKLLQFDPDKMVAATIVFEGTKAEVATQQQTIYSIAKKYGGQPAGAENGKRGYFLTYTIAYLRDIGFEFCLMSESFETSVPWKDVSRLCSRVKQCIVQSAAAKGYSLKPFVSCRVTQVYDSGACVYFYFGIKAEKKFHDNAAKFAQIEDEARDEVLKCNGSLSHHHGVGKLRKRWMEETVTPIGVNMLRSIKRSLDPANIFAANNTI